MSLLFLIVVWVGAVAFVMRQNARAPFPMIGLSNAYLIALSLIHLTGAIVYSLPWFPRQVTSRVALGFTISTIGIVAAAVGMVTVPAMLRLIFPPGSAATSPKRYRIPPFASYLVVGSAMYFVVLPAFFSIPTLNSVLGSGYNFIIAGLLLMCWQGYRTDQTALFRVGMIGAVAFPLVTAAQLGYIGFGVTAAIAILAGVATFHPPKGKTIVLSVIGFYAALTVYQTYMRDRVELRLLVWGNRPFAERFEFLGEMASRPEWFNPQDRTHLSRLEERLNQNWLVGAAAEHLAAERSEFAHGRTYQEAIFAMVPRAMWPNKPLKSGSGTLVTEFAGVPVPTGTSIGIGHVMENYINFGIPGVILGMFLLGAIVAIADQRAAWHLHSGNWQGFGRWYLPAIALLQVEGSFVDLTASAAAALLAIVLFQEVTRFRERPRDARHRGFGVSHPILRRENTVGAVRRGYL